MTSVSRMIARPQIPIHPWTNLSTQKRGAGRDRPDRNLHAYGVKLLRESARIEIALHLVRRQKRSHKVVLNYRDPAVARLFRRKLSLVDVAERQFLKLLLLGVQGGTRIRLRHAGIACGSFAVARELEIGEGREGRSSAVSDLLGHVDLVAGAMKGENFCHLHSARCARLEPNLQVVFSRSERRFQFRRREERSVEWQAARQATLRGIAMLGSKQHQIFASIERISVLQKFQVNEVATQCVDLRGHGVGAYVHALAALGSVDRWNDACTRGCRRSARRGSR